MPSLELKAVQTFVTLNYECNIISEHNYTPQVLELRSAKVTCRLEPEKNEK